VRVAVALDSAIVPAWIARLLSELQDADFVNVTAVLVDAEPAPSIRFGQSLLFRVYEALDYRVFKSKIDACEKVDLAATSMLDGSVSVKLSDDAAASIVRAAEPDVFVWLARARPRRELLDSARFGVWAVSIDASQPYPSIAPLARAVLTDEAVVASTLHVLGADEPADDVIYRSVSAVDPHSLYRTRNPVYWKATHFVSRKLAHVYAAGAAGLHNSRPDESQPRRPARPSNSATLRFGLRLVARFVTSKLRKALYGEAWFIAYRVVRGSPSPEEAGTGVVVAPPRGRYFADPFVTCRGGRHYVLFEDYLIGERRGVISCFEIDSAGAQSKPQVVLERPFHLSYPFTFVHEEQVFMIPETAAARSVELYRAEAFPYRWVHEATLLKDGRLWIFTTTREHGAQFSDELRIFVADSLAGPWKPHRLNPVVSDVRRARPAGRIFDRDGYLVRPGQDSSTGYGRAVVLNRIEVLTEDEYRETPIARIDGSWWGRNLGTHTYTFDGSYEAFDGRRWQRRALPAAVLRRRRRA
jgi:hypothetical protein